MLHSLICGAGTQDPVLGLQPPGGEILVLGNFKDGSLQIQTQEVVTQTLTISDLAS